MVETLESLRTELARLRKLISELRTVGHTGFAAILEESLEKLVSDIANLTSAALEEPAAQQQQQIQPDKDELNKKE
jgi:hypothetical protein